MARRRRNRIIQSQDEYLSEEQIEQERSPGQDVASSELQLATGGSLTESDDDVEVNVQDENGERTKRGRTKLKDIWSLPKGLRIVVACNDLDQPIGDEAGVLGKFLGMVARNGCLCSLSYRDWRLLIGKKERNTNEQKNKMDIIKQVKMRFLYPSRMEKWILRTIGERWRQHKSNLKSLYFDMNKSMEINCSNVPEGVIGDQWIALVNNWMTPKAKEISETNRTNRTKKKSTHTAGTKSFARNREELRQRDPEKKVPHRAMLYIHTHQPKSDKNINEHVGNLKELLVEQPDLADTRQGKIAWKGDALNQILGEDKHGRVHGLGLVPNPNKVFDLSTSRRFKNINLTSLDPTSSEDVLSLRLQMEKVQKHAQIQDANILELKQKTKTLEERQLDQRCLDDPLHATQDAIYVDGPNSKRKRVYGDPQSQQFSMVEQQNNMMRRQNDDEYEDLQPPNKYSTTDKNEWETIQNDNAQQPKKHSSAYKRKEANACDYNVLQAYRASTEAYNTKNKYFKDDVRIDKNKHTNAAKVADLKTSSYCSNHEGSQYKRPYGDPQSQDFSMVEQQNNTMRRQNDDEYEDLQPPNKYSTRDKTKHKHFQDDVRINKNKHTNAAKVAGLETSSYCSNHEGSQNQSKNISKGACAAMRATKQQHGTGSRLVTSSTMAGTTVFLKSWKSQNKKVAVATVVSCDPTHKLDGVPIGNEFWMVRVNVVIAANEALIRPYKTYKFVGDADGANIAWPSTFVEKINW